MKMLRQLPKLLRFIPGTAQDMRAYFLTLQYWLAGSEQNIANMVRLLVDRYADGPRRALRGRSRPIRRSNMPTSAFIIRGSRDGSPRRSTACRRSRTRTGTVGLLLLRSYLLAGNAGHYDGVIAAFEARGLRVIPAFASGLDQRPAIERFFMKDGRSTVDAVVSLTGFSLVGGPAYNDSKAAEDIWPGSTCRICRASGRIPDPGAVGRLGSWIDAGRKHHHGRDPRARWRGGTDGVWRPIGRRGHPLHRLRACLCFRALPDRGRHARLQRARRHAGIADGAAGGNAPRRSRATARSRSCCSISRPMPAIPAPRPFCRYLSRCIARLAAMKREGYQVDVPADRRRAARSGSC